MEDSVKEDILKILDDSIQALREKDSIKLRDISDHTIHNASIFQDKDSITIAVVVYALSKIIDRMSQIEPDIILGLENAVNTLRDGDIGNYEECIKGLIDAISGIDQKLNLYIQRVIREAEIKKGSKLYEHGISLAKTAELLGITQWEMMKYIGQTKIADKFDEESRTEQRLNHTRGLFGL